jgi:hypothetical protein
MKKKIPVILTLLSSALAVGGIVFGVIVANEKVLLQKEVQTLRDQLKTREIASDRTSANEESLAAALKPLSTIETNDISALQQQLAARDAELDELRAELARRQERTSRESFQDRMARMKEEEPERYAEMIKRRTERTEQMRYDQASRLAIFLDMDTSTMTPEELENHNLLLEKLNGLWEQTAAFNPEQPPDRETMRAIFESVGDVRALMEQERAVMLRQLGTEVGLSGSDTEDFSSYVEEIISATSLRWPRGGRGGFGPPRGGNSP